MISAAKKIANGKGVEIPFFAENACALSFDTESFDAVIFSFNGIMTIPAKEMRQKAFNEIYRVLRPGGTFIFTTHDMNNPQYINYWNEERIKWENGEQDKRLLEYGDLIFSNPNAINGSVNFVHVPLDGEIEINLKESGFHLIYNDLRDNICEEKPEVLKIGVNCRFWVVKKGGSMIILDSARKQGLSDFDMLADGQVGDSNDITDAFADKNCTCKA